ncbi:hypothetical protein BJ875DRAFT_393656 [Amylocarpus encephaloides]|uniref:Uncharacterized protein n=1 Tax=Amylocarpus encephaloides TaxID=45428 RepID=A0A9P8C9A1_9HELO|nr:hypothetical protein BJ875DRAFT_393656 [Amylocarpus encephaloides]
MRTSAIFSSLALVSAALAVEERALISGVTITNAAPTKVIAIESFISDYDHHTLGINATVGAIIGQVFALATDYPTPAGALIDFRNRINFIAGPTPFLKDFENPSAVVASISALMPTETPFPQAYEVVSSVYDYLGSVISSELNGQTTLPYNISSSIAVPSSSTESATPTITSAPSSPPPTTYPTGPVCSPYTTTKRPGRWCRWGEKKGGRWNCWN